MDEENIINPRLWSKAKKLADAIYDKPSAYKSGYIVKKYKELGGKFKGKNIKTTGLSRWYREKWVNQHGTTGYKHLDDIYRPSQRVTKKTPTTWKELSKKEIQRASRKKAATGRVKRFRSVSRSKSRIK